MTQGHLPNRRRLCRAPSVLVFALATVLLAGCSSGSRRPSPVKDEDASVIVLEKTPFAELVIPDHSRPGAAEPPARIPIDGPWRYEGSTRAGMHTYSTPIPIRPRGLFFFQPQPGMALTDPRGRALDYDRHGKHDRATWTIDREKLFVYQPERKSPQGTHHFAYPRAVDREAKLNFVFQTRTQSREAFVWQSVQDDWDHRRGLLLPAPGTAAWSVRVPEAAELSFVSGLVEPEVRDGPPSDGATLVVEIDAAGRTIELERYDLETRDFTPRRLDLSRYAGQEATLRLRTEPGASPDFDYAFVAEPVIASRREDPVRVVMVFVDTLRPDHLSLYGYSRDTTASIDHLAEEAVIFEQARSVAPWTLPSARTIVTGRQPEYYLAPETRTLPSILGERGYASAFFAGNVYLAVNFEMHRDWNLHRVGLWPAAKEVTDDALAWLDEHEGQNAVLQVHYMDPHLPYLEPIGYRAMYAGAGPAGFRTEFHLSDVRRARAQNKPDLQEHIKDRYDNNIRYATDQIARLLEKLDDNDIFLFYSDHGEEFWEHGGFEHGHSLFDEVLRVPLAIRAPGVKPRRVDAPVSLLDVTPTVLDLVGEPIPENVDGASLAAVLRGESGADDAFVKRDQGFGRPLYGMEQWGVLHGQMKWSTREGREALYDLHADPLEKANLLKEPADDAGAPYRDHLATALGRPVGAGYRITPTRARTGPGESVLPTWALCSVEGGLKAAWSGNDPLKFGSADVQPIDDPDVIRERLSAYQILGHRVPENPGRAYEICWSSGKVGVREIYLMLHGPLAEVGPTLDCSVYQGDATGGRRATLRVSARRPDLGALRTPVSRATLPQRQMLLQYGISPLPADDVVDTDATDDELSDALTSIGYQQDDYRGPVGDCVPPAVELSVPEELQTTAEKQAE